MLKGRAAEMARLIERYLWDPQSQIYVNRKPSGEFYRHISPTSFYPLQAVATMPSVRAQ